MDTKVEAKSEIESVVNELENEVQANAKTIKELQGKLKPILWEGQKIPTPGTVSCGYELPEARCKLTLELQRIVMMLRENNELLNEILGLQRLSV